MQSITRWDPNEKLTSNEQLSVKFANRLLATQHSFPDPETQAVFAKETEDTTTSDAFLRHWQSGYPDWKDSWNDNWLLAYRCTKAVLDETYFANHPMKRRPQPSPEEVEESSVGIARPEWRNEDYDEDAAALALEQIRHWSV